MELQPTIKVPVGGYLYQVAVEYEKGTYTENGREHQYNHIVITFDKLEERGEDDDENIFFVTFADDDPNYQFTIEDFLEMVNEIQGNPENWKFPIKS